MIKLKRKPDHIKYNALKNAIYLPIDELMPCLRHCPFKELCHMHDIIYGDSDIYFAGCCPIECAIYLNLQEYFTTNLAYATVDKTLTEEYIFLLISIERVRKLISINPDMVTRDNRLSKSYEILSRLQKKFLKVTKEILTAVKEMTK